MPVMLEACPALGLQVWVEETCIDQADFTQVLAKLADFAEEDACRTCVMLLPAVRDVHHVPVFPQPPFRLTNLPPGIRALPNPATFSVNEIVIGTATSDTLKQACYLRGIVMYIQEVCRGRHAQTGVPGPCLKAIALRCEPAQKLCLPSVAMSFAMHRRGAPTAEAT